MTYLSTQSRLRLVCCLEQPVSSLFSPAARRRNSKRQSSTTYPLEPPFGKSKRSSRSEKPVTREDR